MKKRVLIGNAWPYANNNLHVGHLAALLPGDVIARFSRLKGYETVFVSGSDMHGTPITERAKKEGVSPRDIAGKYHEEFVDNFEKMKFTYDMYTNTDTDYHKANVQDFLRTIDKNGYLYEKTEPQAYCETCGKFCSDREIEGKCPSCGKVTRGDQCEFCMATFDADKMSDKVCRTCKKPTSTRENKHLMFKLSAFQGAIEEFAKKNGEAWRWNAVNETKKYLDEGLPDRAVTRDLDWGVEVPLAGYETKRVYVWFEAVLGYLTACKAVLEKKGESFEEFMKKDSGLLAYYVHGKDNIPFHTVIFPSLELAIDPEMQLPTHIVSSEYVNMNDEKMSKSKGNLISVHDLSYNYPADAVRFYTMLYNPEKRDVNFSISEMIQTYNKFLCGGFGNFVNRNLSFIVKKFEGKVPVGKVDPEVYAYVSSLYETMGEKFERAELRSATEDIVSFIQYANKYYDDSKPWIAAKEDLERFGDITATCLFMMANMSNLFAPVIPVGTEALAKTLSLGEPSWSVVTLPESFTLSDVAILYTKIDEKTV